MNMRNSVILLHYRSFTGLEIPQYKRITLEPRIKKVGNKPGECVYTSLQLNILNNEPKEAPQKPKDVEGKKLCTENVLNSTQSK